MLPKALSKYRVIRKLQQTKAALQQSQLCLCNVKLEADSCVKKEDYIYTSPKYVFFNFFTHTCFYNISIFANKIIIEVHPYLCPLEMLAKEPWFVEYDNDFENKV